MSTVGTVGISFRILTAPLRSGLAAAGAAITNATSSWANFGGAISAADVAMGAFAASARTAADLVGDMVMAASDLDESLNLVRVQFGAAAPEVEKAAQQMADRFGIVKSEFLQGAGSIGVVVEAMGKGSDATARMSVDLVKLAADLSSIRNLRFEDVLVGLRAGLGGESEPLKNLGIFVNEAIVQQEAYRAGIAKVGAELTDAQKIQARYNLILSQTTKAQGDLERTADGVANSARAVAGRLENLKADVGSAFTTISQTILASVGGAIADLAADFGDVRAAVKAWADESVRYGGVVSGAVLVVGEAVAMLAQAFELVRVSVAALSASLSAAVGAFTLDFGRMFAAVGDGVEALAGFDANVSGKVRGVVADIRKRMDQIGAAAKNAASVAGGSVASVGAAIRSSVSATRASVSRFASLASGVAGTAMKAAESAREAVQFSGALEFGSAEARTAILSARVSGEDTAAREQVALTKQQVSLQQQALNELRLLGRAFTFQTAEI